MGDEVVKGSILKGLRRLADTLKTRRDFPYTEVLAFEHVRPTSGGGLWTGVREGYKLFRHKALSG